MSIKKAQEIVNAVDTELGISLVSYQNNNLEFLRDKLDAFLALNVETDELSDPGDLEEELDAEEESF